MPVVAGIGYTLLALGPALSLFVSVIAFKPFLVLTVLCSALVWLVSLIFLSAFWRAFLPLGSSPWRALILLFTCVSFQEAIRPLFWKLYKKIETLLNLLADKMSKPQLFFTDKIQIALAGGLGHGVAHAVFFCLSLLTPAFGPATFYTDSCSQMPLFLATSLVSLAFLILHTFSMVIAFTGYEDDHKLQQLFVPGLHFTASFLTLVNLLPGGCIAGIPLVLCCATAGLIYCGKVVWDKTGQASTLALNVARTNIVS